MSGIRVLHCITSLDSDGAQNMLLKLCESRTSPRFEHSVLTLKSGGALEDRFRQCGVPVFTLGMRKDLACLTTPWRLRRTLAEVRPDIVQGWMYHGNIVASMAKAVWAGTQTVLWNIRRALYDLREDKFFTQLAIRGGARISSGPERIIYCGKLIAEQHEALGFDSSKRLVIPNGFDTAKFRPNPEARRFLRDQLGIPHDARVIGMVGRFHPQKDYGNLLAAFDYVARSTPTVHFVLIGRGVEPATPFFRQWVERLGPRLHLLGARNDVHTLLPGLDLFALSSRNEGFPNVVGEAMSAGIPCVVTDAGVAAEVVSDCGIVVPREDSRALADGCAAMLARSEAELRRLGERARERVLTHFDIRSIVQRYEGEYEKQFEIRRGPPATQSHAPLEHRKLVRLTEINQALRYFPFPARVLEIGAGAGWQAALLASRGYEVTAIDIPQSNYHGIQEWPVVDYDGFHIPLEDESVDVVFSSNVMEHIPHVEVFQKEIRRVLKPSGVAVHIMPSATWRIWTTVSFFLDRAKKVFVRGIMKSGMRADPIERSEHYSGKRVSTLGKLRRMLWPSRHGERGNVLTEVYLFSRFRWQKLFRDTGWRVQCVEPNGIFYTGQRLLGSRLALSQRQALSRVAGSSCIMYVLRPT